MKVDPEDAVMLASILPDLIDLFQIEIQAVSAPLVPVDLDAGIDLAALLAHSERQFIEAYYRATGWNLKRTARLLRIKRPTLHDRLLRYGITRPPTLGASTRDLPPAKHSDRVRRTLTALPSATHQYACASR